MRVTIRLFARFRELTGSSVLERDVRDSATVGAVWEGLVSEFPALSDYERAMSAAVNDNYARLTTRVSEGDEVAFLPPVSGG